MKNAVAICCLSAACALLALGARGQALSAPLRVGVYVDDGARSNGWAAWLRLLHSSPQINPILLDGASVRTGALRVTARELEDEVESADARLREIMESLKKGNVTVKIELPDKK